MREKPIPISLQTGYSPNIFYFTDVYFDEPGGVSVTGNLRKRAHLKQHNTNGYSPYRLAVASRAAVSLKKVARLVVASDKK